MSTDDIMQHPANKLSTLSGWGKKNSVTPQTVKAWYDKSVKDGTAPTPFFEEGGTRVFSTLQIEELREKYGQKPKAADAQTIRIAELEALVAQYEEKLSQGAVNYASLQEENRRLNEGLSSLAKQYAELENENQILEEDSEQLARLKAAGVDNWEGYEIAMNDESE